MFTKIELVIIIKTMAVSNQRNSKVCSMAMNNTCGQNNTNSHIQSNSIYWGSSKDGEMLSVSEREVSCGEMLSVSEREVSCGEMLFLQSK